MRKVLIEGGADARYVPPEYLVYAAVDQLQVVRFDANRLQVEGEAVALTRVGRSSYGALYDVADDTMVYLSGDQAPTRLVWFDREGRTEPLDAPAADYGRRFDLSPDGARIALERNSDIWVHDIARGTMNRLTFTGDNGHPIWTADGKRIVFGSSRKGRGAIYWKSADGAGDAEILSAGEHVRNPESVSTDGELLAFREHHPERRWDIWVGPLRNDVDGEALAFLATPFYEAAADFSPDGRWLVYRSDESGREEVYARPYPGPGAKVPISTNGGRSPQWSHDGRAIFYREDDTLMEVEVTSMTPDRLGVNAPRPLFAANWASLRYGYSIAPDDDRFLVAVADGGNREQIYVMTNWTEAIRGLATNR